MMTISDRLKMLLVNAPEFSNFCIKNTANIPRIFLYHKFGNKERDSVNKKLFLWQIQKFLKYSTPCKLNGLSEFFSNTKNPKKPRSVITVDDGYNDFYQIAFPLLKKNNMPATFFITTKFIDGKIRFWFDNLKILLSKTKKKKIVFKHKTKEFIFAINCIEDKIIAWNKLSDYCLYLPEDEKLRFVDYLSECLGVDLSELEIPELMPTSWEEIKEMSRNNIEIGCHTLSHPVLSLLNEEQLVDEIVKSKQVIEKQTGQCIKSFAYPFGTKFDYNQKVINVVKGAGYKKAAVAFAGIPDLNNPYELNRFGVNDNQWDFLWKLTGAEYLFRKYRILTGRYCTTRIY